MDKEIPFQENPPFDLSKVQDKLKNIKTLADLTGPGGAMQELMKQAVERILKAEQEDHLGYEPYQKASLPQTNSRNGYSKKTVETSTGPMELKIPRDREGTFEPKLVEKYQTFDPDLEKKIIGMYSRGMSTRDIQSQLEEFYCTNVSISRITDKVLDGVKEWQSRPLDDIYPVLFMDAIHYKIRQDGKVISKAAYTCMGINLEGKVDVLGLWLAENEGAHFWLGVMSELKTRGVKDILITCVDGLKSFPEAIGSAFPKAQIQLCIVHQIRNSLRYVASKHHKEFMKDLKQVYRAPSLDIAEAELDQLESKWKTRSPFAVAGWRNNWSNLSTYFAYPPEIRKMIYTTNSVEALHRQFRKVTKTKGSFPTDDALKKMLYLATLVRSKQGWSQILGQLKIIFEERIPQHVN